MATARGSGVPSSEIGCDFIVGGAVKFLAVPLCAINKVYAHYVSTTLVSLGQLCGSHMLFGGFHVSLARVNGGL